VLVGLKPSEMAPALALSAQRRFPPWAAQRASESESPAGDGANREPGRGWGRGLFATGHHAGTRSQSSPCGAMAAAAAGHRKRMTLRRKRGVTVNQRILSVRGRTASSADRGRAATGRPRAGTAPRMRLVCYRRPGIRAGDLEQRVERLSGARLIARYRLQRSERRCPAINGSAASRAQERRGVSRTTCPGRTTIWRTTFLTPAVTGDHHWVHQDAPFTHGSDVRDRQDPSDGRSMGLRGDDRMRPGVSQAMCAQHSRRRGTGVTPSARMRARGLPQALMPSIPGGVTRVPVSVASSVSISGWPGAIPVSRAAHSATGPATS